MGPLSRTAWIQHLMRQHEGALVRYATRLTGNVETARDVVQDTFFRLCEAERGRVEVQVKAWLFRVCRNRALDLLRKGKGMSNASEAQLSSCEATEPSPAAVAQQRQSVGQVMRLLGRLPPKQQEVVRLKFQQGLSYREIAAVTGFSQTNVGFLLHKAIATLRQRMTEQPAAARRSR